MRLDGDGSLEDMTENKNGLMVFVDVQRDGALRAHSGSIEHAVASVSAEANQLSRLDDVTDRARELDRVVFVCEELELVDRVLSRVVSEQHLEDEIWRRRCRWRRGRSRRSCWRWRWRRRLGCCCGAHASEKRWVVRVGAVGRGVHKIAEHECVCVGGSVRRSVGVGGHARGRVGAHTPGVRALV